MARGRRARVGLVGGLLRSRSFNRGLLGDSLLWRAVFYLVAARAIGRKLFGSDGEVVLSERLRPGQPLQLVAIDGKARKRERRAARAAGMSRRAARKL